MPFLHIAEHADNSMSLRELCDAKKDTSNSEVDQALRDVMGNKVYYLNSKQMFGFSEIEATMADRIHLASPAEMTVRYVGLRAIRASHDFHAEKRSLAIVEDREFVVAVFDTDIARIDQKLDDSDEPTIVPDLFPQVGVLLDEPIALRTLNIPRPSPQYFRPRVV